VSAVVERGKWEKEESAIKRHWKLALVLIPLLLLLAVLAGAFLPAIFPSSFHKASNAIVTTAGEKVSNTAAAIATTWHRGLAGLQGKTSEMWNSLAVKTSVLGDWTAGMFKGMWERLKFIFSYVPYAVSQPFEKAWHYGSSLASWSWQNLSGLASGTFDIACSLFSNIWNGVQSFVSGTWNIGLNISKKVWNGASSLFTGTWNVASSWALNAWHGLANLLSGAWNMGAYAASQVWHGMTSFLSGTRQNIITWTRGVWDTVSSLAARSWHGLSQNLSSGIYQAPSLIYSGVQTAGRLVSSPFLLLWNSAGGFIQHAQSVPAALGKGFMYPVNLSWTGLTWLGQQLGPAVQNWLLSPLLGGLSSAARGISWLWSWLWSGLTGIPSSFPSLGSLTAGPAYMSHMVGSAWEKTRGFIYPPLDSLKHSSSSTNTDIDNLVDKILASQRFQEALSLMVLSSQAAGTPEGKALLAEYNRLETDLGAKFDFQLVEARTMLTDLAHSLSRDLARDVQAGQEEQAAKEKKLEELLRILREQEALFKEKADQLASLQSETAKAAQLKSDQLRAEMVKLKDQLTRLETELAEMVAGMRSCCKTSAEIEADMRAVLGDLLTGKGDTGLTDQLAAWLGRLFVNKSELDEKLLQAVNTAATSGQPAQDQLVSHITERIRTELLRNATVGTSGPVMTPEQVTAIVQAALVQYDADKTGQFDYALETAGGSVVSTRCTETYIQKTALYSIFGIPVWYPSNNPRTIIQPGVQPGQCWAFKGSAGFVVIQLSEPVKPTSFSMEHIAQSMSPSERIDSAPRDFVVLGLRSEKDPKPFQLGSYTYSQEGGRLPLQFFAVESPSEEFFPYIELDINSNHGNVNYTCLYRFRVHGTPLSSG